MEYKEFLSFDNEILDDANRYAEMLSSMQNIYCENNQTEIIQENNEENQIENIYQEINTLVEEKAQLNNQKEKVYKEKKII